jgi:hypothetical protein
MLNLPNARARRTILPSRPADGMICPQISDNRKAGRNSKTINGTFRSALLRVSSATVPVLVGNSNSDVPVVQSAQ